MIFWKLELILNCHTLKAKGKVRLPNRMNFRKSDKGGVVIFNPKKYIADIGTLNRTFWSWNWYKIVIIGFRVCFFQEFYWEKSKQDTLWRGHFWIPILSDHHTSSLIRNHIFHKKNCNIVFRKWGGWGPKAVWNFSENSSDLVAGSFP